MRWNEHKPLRDWMRASRLDAFGKLTASVDRADAQKMAVLGELRQQTMAATANATRLLGLDPSRPS
jgi:hypothetical protein